MMFDVNLPQVPGTAVYFLRQGLRRVAFAKKRNLSGYKHNLTVFSEIAVLPSTRETRKNKNLRVVDFGSKVVSLGPGQLNHHFGALQAKII